MRRINDDVIFRASVNHDQQDGASSRLLPWADPYIAMLAEAHRRQAREEALRQARALAAHLVLPRRKPVAGAVEAAAA